MAIYKIIPRKGLGPIKFGFSREDVQKILGQPEEIEEHNDIKDEIDIYWHYPSLGLSLYFNEDEQYKLGLIEITDTQHQLYSMSLSTLTFDNFQELLTKNSVLDVCISKLIDEDVVKSESQGFVIYFENNNFYSIQISPIFLDENTIDWPK